MDNMTLIVCTILAIFAKLSYCYQGVMIVPGLTVIPSNFDQVKQQILEAHPGTDIVVASVASGLLSTSAIWTQVDATYKNSDVKAFLARNPDGFHVFGLSEGNLVARGMVQKYGLPVITYISAAGIHAGFYGIPKFIIDFGKTLGENNIILSEFYRLMYTLVSQNTLFVAGFWNDPCQYQSYVKNNIFLPVLNCEKNHTDCPTYKKNFLKIKDLYLFAGPDDGVIVPWQSGLFRYISCNGTELNTTDLQMYKDDSFGLKTLDLRGGLHMEIFPNVTHDDFIGENFLASNVIPLLT